MSGVPSRWERLTRLAESRERTEAEGLRRARAAEDAAAREADRSGRRAAGRLAALRGGAGVGDLAGWAADRGALLAERGEARAAARRLTTARQGVDGARTAYLRAHADTEALRRVGRRREDERRRAEAAGLQGALDELAALRAARARGRGGEGGA